MGEVKEDYAVLNKLNLKYGVSSTEVNEKETANNFIQSFKALYGLGKIEEKDFKRGMVSYERLNEEGTHE